MSLKENRTQILLINMCTCIKTKTNYNFFGRNMDLDYDFDGKVIVVSRKFILRYKIVHDMKEHFAFIGMGKMLKNYPFFADGINEHGLSIAALRFEGYAKYNNAKSDKINLAPYEIIPFFLGKCRNVKEALIYLNNLNIINFDYDEDIKVSSLHWMISDKDESYIIEQTQDGLKLYKNPYHVLTNHPKFEYHLENIKNYTFINNQIRASNFSNKLNVGDMGLGSSTFSLPGDFTSPSRFVRAAYLANNLVCELEYSLSLMQFFEVLNNVSFIKGAVLTENNRFEFTCYSSCMDQDLIIYRYKTYKCPCFKEFKLFNYEISEDKIYIF